MLGFLYNAKLFNRDNAYVGATCAPNFLAICGNSGCCKTSTVQLLCAEEGISIVEWSQNMWESEATSLWYQNSAELTLDEYSSGSGINREEVRAENTYDIAVSSGYSTTARDLFKVEGVTRGAWFSKVNYIIWDRHTCHHIAMCTYICLNYLRIKVPIDT